MNVFFFLFFFILPKHTNRFLIFQSTPDGYHTIYFQEEEGKMSTRLWNYQTLLFVHRQENGQNLLVQSRFTCPKIYIFLISQRKHMSRLIRGLVT